MPWISNHKHKIEEKSTKSSHSSSKVVGLGLVDWCEFPTLSRQPRVFRHLTLLLSPLSLYIDICVCGKKFWRLCWWPWVKVTLPVKCQHFALSLIKVEKHSSNLYKTWKLYPPSHISHLQGCQSFDQLEGIGRNVARCIVQSFFIMGHKSAISRWHMVI